MAQKIHNIVLSNQEKLFECPSNDSILDAGLRHGLAMRYDCSNGTCGSCIAKLKTGEIQKIKHHDYSIQNELVEQGAFLMCCHAPLSDLNIEVDLISGVKSIPIQNIVTKVKKITRINENFISLIIRTPRSKTLQFMAGQQVELCYQDISARYPLASCPCNGMELEFHIRNIDSDAFSQILFNGDLSAKSDIQIIGPDGIFVLREESINKMVFIAWDGGFAPVRSLIEHAISLERDNEINFFWAFPAVDKEPYLNRHAKSWNAVLDEYSYSTIPCDFDRSLDNDCELIAETIFNNLLSTDLKSADIYICAPAELLIKLSELIISSGVDEKNILGSPL